MSDLTPFLLCGPAAEIVRGFAERRKAAGEAWERFAVAKGGDPKVIHGEFTLQGVKFETPPKGWVRAHKNWPGYWKPGKRSPDLVEFDAVRLCDFHRWHILSALKISPFDRMGLAWDGETPILYLDCETWPASAVPAGYRIARSEVMRLEEGKDLTDEAAREWAAFVAEYGAAEVSDV